MCKDILTMMWKESKGLLRYSSKRWKSVVILIMPIALFGIIFPLQFREGWLTSYWSVIVALITPLLLIATTISESFAGERERHTLETLLASRLPDKAILLGKLLVSVLFGWGMTLFLLLISLVVVNILTWDGAFLFYQPEILGIDLSASFLMSGMVASLGILISLRSPTVQNAAQSLMLMLFMPFLFLQAVVFLLPTFMPVELVKNFLVQLDVLSIALVIIGIILLTNLGLLLGAISGFQRSKLLSS